MHIMYVLPQHQELISFDHFKVFLGNISRFYQSDVRLKTAIRLINNNKKLLLKSISVVSYINYS